jgi:hypothetical protein
MTTRLIVNADDYGLTPGTSRGIREAHLRGIVTATTCMMNLPGAAADIETALAETPRLGLGVHLVLTANRPLSPRDRVQTITDEHGYFFKQGVLIQKLDTIDAGEVKAEWRAQIEAFIAAAGRKPTHLDSHHHSSYFTPALVRAMFELTKEYDCALRLPLHPETGLMSGVPGAFAGAVIAATPGLLADFKPRHPAAFFDTFYADGATKAELFRILSVLDEDTYEVMTHPGYTAGGLSDISSYTAPRETEIAVLTDPDVKQAVLERGIALVSFDALR